MEYEICEPRLELSHSPLDVQVASTEDVVVCEVVVIFVQVTVSPAAIVSEGGLKAKLDIVTTWLAAWASCRIASEATVVNARRKVLSVLIFIL